MLMAGHRVGLLIWNRLRFFKNSKEKLQETWRRKEKGFGIAQKPAWPDF